MPGDYKDVTVKLVTDKDAAPIQVLKADANVNGTASATPTNNTALPSNSQVVMVSTTAACWVKFGPSGVTVSAGDTGAILVPGGGVTLALDEEDTHTAWVRASSDDALVSISRMV